MLWGAYAASQRPSRLAASTCATPAGLILPCSISSVALRQLTCDHLLRGPRGPKRWSQKVASLAPFCPSIQP